jgi:hypothetical protein
MTEQEPAQPANADRPPFTGLAGAAAVATRMARGEAIVVAAFLLTACPVSAFVTVWWGTAALALWGLAAISERSVAAASLSALGAGVVFTAVLVRRLVPRFYALPWTLLVGAYFFWSAVAIALFMGLPAGEVALGVLPGLYVGRRLAHEGADAALARGACRRAALFGAAVTGTWSVTMGCLALRDQHSLTVLLTLAGLKALGETVAGRALVVAAAVPALTLLQYVLTRRAASWAFRLRPAGTHP